MSQIVNVVIFDTGHQYAIPVKIDLLPEWLKEKYDQFAGKTVKWNGDKLEEVEME